MAHSTGYLVLTAQFRNKDANGNLEYASVIPGAKQALAKLSEWMDKAYIHTDSALGDEGKSAENWTAGKACILLGETGFQTGLHLT